MNMGLYTAQKINFPIKDFFIKCDQNRKKLYFMCSDIAKIFFNIVFCKFK